MKNKDNEAGGGGSSVMFIVIGLILFFLKLGLNQFQDNDNGITAEQRVKMSRILEERTDFYTFTRYKIINLPTEKFNLGADDPKAVALLADIGYTETETLSIAVVRDNTAAILIPEDSPNGLIPFENEEAITASKSLFDAAENLLPQVQTIFDGYDHTAKDEYMIYFRMSDGTTLEHPIRRFSPDNTPEENTIIAAFSVFFAAF